MRIIVLMGSPNRQGSTGILVKHFKKGAEEASYYARRTLGKVQKKLGFVQL